eukprot:g61055.t1
MCCAVSQSEMFLDTHYVCRAALCDGTCAEPPQWVHQMHFVFFGASFLIMSLFALELLLLVVALGLRKFVRNRLYVLDLVVVAVALALEVLVRLKEIREEEHHARSEPGDSSALLEEQLANNLSTLLLLSRTWRFVRIGHGVFEVTHELDEGEAQQKIEKLREEISLLESRKQQQATLSTRLLTDSSKSQY